MSACDTIQVTDETASSLTYNAPVNVQTFAVRVQSDRTVRNVDLRVRGFGSMVMDRIAGDLYTGEVLLPVCLEAAEFSVAVTTAAPIGRGDSDPREFPEAGRFTHMIAEQPPECAEFSMSVSQTFLVDRREDFPDTNRVMVSVLILVPMSAAAHCAQRSWRQTRATAPI